MTNANASKGGKIFFCFGLDAAGADGDEKELYEKTENNNIKCCIKHNYFKYNMREDFPSLPFDIITSTSGGGVVSCLAGDISKTLGGNSTSVSSDHINLKFGKDIAIEGKIDRESDIFKSSPSIVPTVNSSNSATATTATSSTKERYLNKDSDNVVSDTNDTQSYASNVSTSVSTAPAAANTTNATATSPSVYTVAPFPGELEELQNILHFPEEVALRLTDTEYQLFYQVRRNYTILHSMSGPENQFYRKIYRFFSKHVLLFASTTK